MDANRMMNEGRQTKDEGLVPSAVEGRMPAVLLSCFSGTLLSMAFSKWNLWFLAWVGLVPLFMAIEGKRLARAFRLSYVCGIVFFAGTIYWVGHVTHLGLAALILYLALYFGIFGLLVNFSLLSTLYSLLIIPALWVALEFIRSHALTGFGWALLGYSQYKVLPVIQIADIFGAYGVSFLVVMVNVAIYGLWSYGRMVVRSYGRVVAGYGCQLPASPAGGLVVILCIAAALSYGCLKLRQNFSGPAIRVSVIQGNIPQEEKWDDAYKTAILDKYSLLTKLASQDEPDLIVWPETSVPGILNEERQLREKVAGLAKDANRPLLVGAAMAGSPEIYFNSAVLLSDMGEFLNRYDKLHLVPFGEFIPFEERFPFLRVGRLQDAGAFSRGSVLGLFEMSTAKICVADVGAFAGASGVCCTDGLSTVKDGGFRCKFAALICFEDIFPDLVRRFANKGADFLVNITNDAWFGKTAAPYQHAQASVFRAVENRIEVVRAANTGLSCFIDKHGKISAKVCDGAGEEVFVPGYATAQVRLKGAPTFYGRFGDILPLLCFLALPALVRRRAGKNEPAGREESIEEMR